MSLLRTRYRRFGRGLGGWAIVFAIMALITGSFAVAAGGLNRSRGSAEAGGGRTPLATTSEDYFQGGTQPLGAGGSGEFDELLPYLQCISCHASYGPSDPFLMVEAHGTWAASMMGQSARDPLFYAGLTIANQDATGSGELCIRCHAPNAFLGGRAHPTDASAFTLQDLEGINCNFCHRAVDPEFKVGISPSEDEAILNTLAAAGLIPHEGSNARYVIDPTDSRRGPFDDVPINMHLGNPIPEIIHSPYHAMAEFCWNCHDVSNPLMVRQADDTYVLDTLDAPHPTGKQEDMFPLHRTYSEWKNSYYSSIGIQHNGRFGGNHPTGVMKTCQDCHMPDMQGFGCNFEFEPFFQRENVPQHSFLGSNTWVLRAIRAMDANGDGQPDFPDSQTGLSDALVQAAITRNIDFLERASDMILDVLDSGDLRVRILNRTGHKLPTGFPDGRRVWINVKFFDCQDNLIREHGAYDFETATLTTDDTKVYEIKLGIAGEEYAQQVGHPEGPTFHVMLANTILKDNRIPPAGFSNVIAQQNQTMPVGATYANGQNWDDTLFTIPESARAAVVTVYYQLNSKEFMEFLRDANHTDNRGQVAYDLWVQFGKSLPVVMDMGQVQLFHPADINHDGNVNVEDVLAVIAAWGTCPIECPADVDGDSVVDVTDLLLVIAAWGSC